MRLKPVRAAEAAASGGGQAGGAAGVDAGAADHGQGDLQFGAPRPLRVGGQGVSSLHLADPALPGPGGPPDAAAAAGGRPAGARDGPGTGRAGAGRAWRAAARPRSSGPSRPSGWRCCGRRSSIWRRGWGGLRGHGDRGEGLRALRAARRVSDRRLVHISELLDDYYRYEEERHRLVGERHRRQYRLGDPIEVEVVRVDLEAMQVELCRWGDGAEGP